MKKLISLLLGLCFIFSLSTAKADEGMWLLSQLNKNIAEMQEMGLELTANDIYDINNSSLKDAFVGFGTEGRPFRHFCTGGIISDEGLVITNHHCGFGKIQAHSTTEKNYLADGFWAYDKSEELTNPGLTLSILVRMEDVTDQIVPKLTDDMTEEKRYETIDTLSNEIVKKAEKETYYKANVKSMFNGNQFFLFVYVIYKDVRLVGAPPASLGKFGGDTDNWMWPRHTADFSLFRIYTDPEGKPASYSEDNIPLKPKHHMPVSIKGVEEGDFSMIMGFPGTTNRYLTSFGLKETIKRNANRFNIRDEKLKLLKEDMEKDPKIKLQYASKYARSANYWKYSIEQNKALARLKTVAIKESLEKNFMEWANATPGRSNKYGEVLKTIEKAYTDRKTKINTFLFLSESLSRGSEIPSFAADAKSLNILLGKNLDADTLKDATDELRKSAKAFYKDYNANTDKKLMVALFKMFSKNIAKNEHPDIFKTIEGKYKNDISKFADDLFKKSIFTDENRFNDFLDDPKKKVLENDLAYITGISINKKRKSIMKGAKKINAELKKGKRLFVEGILQMNAEKNLAPDANSTFRFTYGKVGGYIPRDAVNYKYFTTIDGVIEKEDPNSTEFIVPEKLKELYKAKDFGQYADTDGNLRACFLTNHDITGGNSGSPVINAKGEYIGAAFDGNSEAMSGDVDFEENLQRCINVDSRYILFIIDKLAGAKNLIEEMTIVK